MQIQSKPNTTSRRLHEHGFTLVEIGVVLVLVALIIGALMTVVPRVLMNSRVNTGITELVRAMTTTKVAASNSGSSTPYAGITTGQFSGALNGGSVFKVTGTGATATIGHSLSYLSTGVVTVAAATNVTLGDSYAITMTLANQYSCPDFLAGMDSITQKMVVNTITVKDATAGTTFNALTASVNCAGGDTNTYVLTGN